MNLSETLPRTTAAQKVAARTAILDLAGPAVEEGGAFAAAASFSLTLSAREEEEEVLRFSIFSSQGSQIFPSSAQAPMCSSVSNKGLLNPKFDKRARFISRMPVFAAYQAATTKKVRRESREIRREKEGGEGAAAKAEVDFVWRRRDDDDKDDDDEEDDENGLPKNAATAPTSEEEEEAKEELTRAGDRGGGGGGGKNDDGDGFS